MPCHATDRKNVQTPLAAFRAKRKEHVQQFSLQSHSVNVCCASKLPYAMYLLLFSIHHKYIRSHARTYIHTRQIHNHSVFVWPHFKLVACLLLPMKTAGFVFIVVGFISSLIWFQLVALSLCCFLCSVFFVFGAAYWAKFCTSNFQLFAIILQQDNAGCCFVHTRSEDTKK